MTNLHFLKFRSLFFSVAGCLLTAVGIYNFALPAAFPMTGFSGVSIILYRLFALPVGFTTILLNIPVSFLCFRRLGKTFFLRSMGCMLLSSLMMDLLCPLLPTYNGSRLLAAICTGVIAGMGYALIYMQYSSTGGMDFITMTIKSYKPYLSLGRIVFFTDTIIILIGGFLFRDMDGILYGLIVSSLFALVIDKTMYGINAGKLSLIVTTQVDAVTNAIHQSIRRGSTILPGFGGYQGESRFIILCACSNKEMYQVSQAIKAADPDSFLIILESSEVHGEGFHPLRLGESMSPNEKPH